MKRKVASIGQAIVYAVKSCAVLLYSKLVLLADTSFVLLKVGIDTHYVMGFVPHTKKYSY